MMRRALLAAVAAVLAGGLLPQPRQGQCLFQGDWGCSGQPQYNGPLQNTWSHGLTQMPQICPGGADMQPCRFYVPQP
jgi:hypothetical protein